MIPSKRTRDHSWDKWHELTETYTLEDSKGKIWKGRVKSIGPSQKQAEFTGFLGFCQVLSSLGVHIPKTIRSVDADFKWGEKESPGMEDS